MTVSWDSIFALSEAVGCQLRERKLNLASAESCTAGGISYAITHIPGSSGWFSGGITAYSNQVKINQLDINESLIAQKGAVSEEVAALMAFGAARLMGTDIGVSTSGIAGPDGGTPDKPVGTVCFGWSVFTDKTTETKHFSGNRESVRLQSIDYSLKTLLERL